jgi:hypothetical protein
MANTLINLLVKLGLDAKDFNKGVDESEKKAQTGGQKIASGLAGVGGTVVKGALAGAAAGLAALTGFTISSIGAAAEAEGAQAQLASVLQATGGAAGVTAQQVNDLATAFGETTKFEDDAIVAGENLLLTFTGIGKDVFPLTTQTMLDMSQAMGQDMKSSALQLGKALNDPSEGMTALTRVGVTFTKEQEKQIKTMQKAGDMAGAQTVILNELQREFGGAAEAAGETFAGKMEIAKNKIGNISETIGTALLPIVTTAATLFNDWLNSDFVQEGLIQLTDGITSLADAFMVGFGPDGDMIAGLSNAFYSLGGVSPIFDDIGDAIVWVGEAIPASFGWLMNNQGVIVGILAAIGVAVGVFVYTSVVPAAIAAITALAPIIAVMALIGIAAYLLYQAWTTNFGGIRDILTEVWEGTLKPAFETLWNWLQVNLPLALAWLSDQWENVLLPAITRVWAWIQGTLFPLFVTAYEWLKVKVPEALAWLADKWETVLLPAIKRVWEWMNTVLFPFFKEVGDFISAVFTLAVQELSKAWEEKLLPGIKGVWKFLKEDALPFFKEVGDWLGKTFSPIIATVAGIVRDSLGAAFQWAGEKFAEFRQTLRDLTDWINVLTGKSETVKGNLPPVAENASGGSAAAGTYSWVGERGPELMYFPQDAYIINNLSSQRLVDDLTGGEEVNNSSMVQFNISPHYYKGDEPTLLDEVNDLTLMFGVP